MKRRNRDNDGGGSSLRRACEGTNSVSYVATFSKHGGARGLTDRVEHVETSAINTRMSLLFTQEIIDACRQRTKQNRNDRFSLCDGGLRATAGWPCLPNQGHCGTKASKKLRMASAGFAGHNPSRKPPGGRGNLEIACNRGPFPDKKPKGKVLVCLCSACGGGSFLAHLRAGTRRLRGSISADS